MRVTRQHVKLYPIPLKVDVLMLTGLLTDSQQKLFTLKLGTLRFCNLYNEIFINSSIGSEMCCANLYLLPMPDVCECVICYVKGCKWQKKKNELEFFYPQELWRNWKTFPFFLLPSYRCYYNIFFPFIRTLE